MELHHGRPADWSTRQDRERRVYDLLDRLEVDYHRIDHPAAMTMEDCAALESVLGTSICKNLLLCNRQCTAFYLLLLPAGKPLRTKDLSAQIGSSRLSFADGAYMMAFLDIAPGSLSILGLMNDGENRVQLLIDRDVLSQKYIGCHPCVNTSSLRICTQDMVDRILPAMGHAPILVTL